MESNEVRYDDARRSDQGQADLACFLTPSQVAEMLQVSEKTVGRWALEDASMPVLRRGRVVRFERSHLLAWLARRESRSARRSARSTQAAPPAADVAENATVAGEERHDSAVNRTITARALDQ